VRFLVVSDAPQLSSGLARISRDLCSLIQSLGHQVASLGWDYDDTPMPWQCFPIRDHDNWGKDDLPKVWWKAHGNNPGVVLTVWDPARCFDLTMAAGNMPVQLWGYFPLDSANVNGKVSGPALVALRRYQRVLAYGRYGAEVLKASLGRPIQWLPHGMDLTRFDYPHSAASSGAAEGSDRNSAQAVAASSSPLASAPRGSDRIGTYPLCHEVSSATAFVRCEECGGDFSMPRQQQQAPVPASAPAFPLVGCVATNNARKDLGALFAAWKLLAERDSSLTFWLHTNTEIGPAWSVPQLAEDFGLEGRLLVTTPQSAGSDEILANLYAQCAVTIAPGLGEGFGYPIVESLACGTPVVHVDFAGGAELVPHEDWLCRYEATRTESVYALVRPVLDPAEIANRAWRAIEWKRKEPRVVQAWCRATVQHLGWEYLGRMWRAWVQQGVVGMGSE